MPEIGLIFLLDVALVIHAAKTGRFSPWGYVIIFLPGIGGLAYFVVELLPEWLGSYKIQRAQQHVARVVNPGRRYRELADELGVVDTIANRTALGEECLDLGKFEEARGHYQSVIERPLGDEPKYHLGRAQAEFGLERPDAAIATLEELKRQWPDWRSPEGHLLYARALEKAGRAEEALENYAGVGRYYPGAEPRVRQAQLLQSLGRGPEAAAIANEVVVGLKRAPNHVRKSQREWLASALKIAQG